MIAAGLGCRIQTKGPRHACVRLLCGLVFVGMAQQARAADLGEIVPARIETVITAPGGTRWDGFYVGGQVGATVPGIDFTNDTSRYVGMLRDTTIENDTDRRRRSAAEFDRHALRRLHRLQRAMGRRGDRRRRDLQLDRQVARPRRTPMSGGFATADERLTYTADGHRNGAHHRLRHAARARRLGGRQCSCRMRRSASRWGAWTSTYRRGDAGATGATPVGLFMPPTDHRDQNLTNQFGYGYAAGLGVDFCLMANLFVRAEYEYMAIPGFPGPQRPHP